MNPANQAGPGMETDQHSGECGQDSGLNDAESEPNRLCKDETAFSAGERAHWAEAVEVLDRSAARHKATLLGIQ